MLAERAAAADSPPVALTLVSEGCLAGLLRDLAALCAAAGVEVQVTPGADLSRRSATIGRGGTGTAFPKLVVVERIDQGGGSDAHLAAAMLLDDLDRQGVSSCVTVGRTPAAGDLAPALASRLAGSLVVHVPPRPSESPLDREPWSLPRIVRSAARCHGLPAAALVGPSRSRTVVQARNLAMYLARHLTGSSFGTIGEAFGGREHTTVLRGVRAIELRLAEDAGFAAELDRLLADSRGPRRRDRAV